MALAIATTIIPLMWDGVANNSTHKLSVTGRTGNVTFAVWGSYDGLPPGITIQQPAPGSNDAFLVGTPTVSPTSREQYYCGFIATDDNGDSPPTVLFLCLAEDPHAGKIAVVQIADSRGYEPLHDYETLGWKPNMRRLLGDADFQFYGGQNVRFGQQSATLQGLIPDYTTPIYDAGRPDNWAVCRGGVLNDMQSNPSYTGAQLAQLSQNLINAAKAVGFKGIGSCGGAGDYSGIGSMDAQRVIANSIIRGLTPLSTGPDVYFSADAVELTGVLSEFDAIADTVNTEWYESDKIHYTLPATYRYKLCPEDCKALAKLATAPLTAVFDIESVYTDEEDIVPFSVIPFPETGTKTWNWKVNGVSKSTSQNPVAADFAGLTPGSYTMVLEVTQSGNTVTSSKSFVVISAGNVGGGSVDPAYSLIAEDDAVNLTAVGFTPDYWRVVSGPGALSGTSPKVYTDANPHGLAIIEANEEMWANPPANGSINSSQQWDMTGGGGTPTNIMIPHIDGSGITIKFRVPSRNNPDVSTGSYFRLSQTTTGKFWQLNLKDNQFVSNPGTGNNVAGTEAGLVADDEVKFKILVSGEIEIYLNDVYLYSFDDLITSFAFHLLMVCYDDLGKFLWHRPTISGANADTNISSWKAGTAVVETATFPTAGFSLDGVTGGEVDATDVVTVVDTSTSADSYSYEITNDEFTDHEIATTAEPEVSTFFKMGSNTIKQIVTNSNGTDESEITFTVNPKIITPVAGSPYDLSGLPEGFELRSAVRMVDAEGTRYGYSNYDTYST